jgi:hypothetical protein
MKFHSQRARDEDPVVITGWFKLVEETHQTYGILDTDIYNFDETGFIMGVAATSKVVTSSDTIGVYHIAKVDFLTIYRQTRPKVFTEQNINAGFQATGLIPYCPDRVLSSLTVVRTTSPPATTVDSNIAWTAETPRTVTQLEQQALHVRDLLHRQP